MLKEESTNMVDVNSWGRVCDTCRSAPCTVYCRADSAYLCTGCDVRIHAANTASSRHERVWVCEACERAPAAFLCKADAASLCTACDADIHAANPLARRHHRVPILPISGSLCGPPANRPANHEADGDNGFLTHQEGDETVNHHDDDEEAASWLLINPVKNNPNSSGHGYLFGEEVGDEYLDLGEYNSCQDSQFTDHYHHKEQQQQDIVVPHKSYGGDSVVPVRSGNGKGQLQEQQQQYHSYHFEVMEYETSKDGYGYPPSLSHSVSVSSMDMGVVPEPTSSDNISVSHPRPPKGTIDLFSSQPIHAPTQLTPMDREARVLRYREKKKTRKFEKTIRYASRKAYAETRPRIKGRFAKRTNVEAEVDQMFTTTLITEGGYGIVPSF